MGSEEVGWVGWRVYEFYDLAQTYEIVTTKGVHLKKELLLGSRALTIAAYNKIACQDLTVGGVSAGFHLAKILHTLEGTGDHIELQRSESGEFVEETERNIR